MLERFERIGDIAGSFQNVLTLAILLIPWFFLIIPKARTWLFGSVKNKVLASVWAPVVLGFLGAGLACAIAIIFLNPSPALSDAVVAFNEECPLGWVPYDQARSRIIIGAATAADLQNKVVVGFGSGTDGKLLTEKPFRRPGGQEQHALLHEQMPRHTHTYHTGVRSGKGTNEGIPSPQFLPSGWLPQDYPTLPAGGLPDGTTQAFSLMPPYIALNYCIKTR